MLIKHLPFRFRTVSVTQWLYNGTRGDNLLLLLESYKRRVGTMNYYILVYICVVLLLHITIQTTLQFGDEDNTLYIQHGSDKHPSPRSSGA